MQSSCELTRLTSEADLMRRAGNGRYEEKSIQRTPIPRPFLPSAPSRWNAPSITQDQWQARAEIESSVLMASIEDQFHQRQGRWMELQAP